MTNKGNTIMRNDNIEKFNISFHNSLNLNIKNKNNGIDRSI